MTALIISNAILWVTNIALVLTVLGIAVVRSAAWLVARPQFDRVARFAPRGPPCGAGPDIDRRELP